MEVIILHEDALDALLYGLYATHMKIFYEQDIAKGNQSLVVDDQVYHKIAETNNGTEIYEN